MIIKVLDHDSLGFDLDLSPLHAFGETEVYGATEKDELHKRVADAEVIIINKIKVDRACMLAAPNLKLICIFATGYDNIDTVAARELGIGVCNVPGYSTDSVTLLTVSTALALVSHLNEYNRYVTSGEYTEKGIPNRLEPVFHEVSGKTWGIIGAGNIGSAVARVAEALGARVVACKRSPSDKFECVDIDTLCRRSDIITIHCPLNDGTRGLISNEKISLMKNGVIIVNEARGAVVVDDAIVEGIESGKIGGFGSDVYNEEPFSKEHPFNKIMHRDNVILTPHCAWGAKEARDRCLKIICDNISSFLKGERLNRVE